VEVRDPRMNFSLLQTLGGEKGAGSSRFAEPTGLCMDDTNTLMVVDYGNHRMLLNISIGCTCKNVTVYNYNIPVPFHTHSHAILAGFTLPGRQVPSVGPLSSVWRSSDVKLILYVVEEL
jgi:hypothetical protein